MRELFVKSARASLHHTVSAAGSQLGPLSPLSDRHRLISRPGASPHTREYFLKSDDDGCEEIFPDILRLHHSSDWLPVSQMRAYYIVIV